MYSERSTTEIIRNFASDALHAESRIARLPVPITHSLDVQTEDPNVFAVAERSQAIAHGQYPGRGHSLSTKQGYSPATVERSKVSIDRQLSSASDKLHTTIIVMISRSVSCCIRREFVGIKKIQTYLICFRGV